MRVAIIPARGGSKRIPRKNIRPFVGKPIIGYSIECAQQSGLFERVIVSTEDAEIAATARRFGAEVPFERPVALSDDRSGTGPVVAHAIDWLRKENQSPRDVCCIYATAPFIQPQDLRTGLHLLETGDWHFVFAATDYGYPVSRSFRQTAGGGLQMFDPASFAARSQDLPEALHDAGQFYWARAEAWSDTSQIFGPNSTIVRIPRWRVQDIDTEDDWVRAEAMTSYLLPAVTPFPSPK